MPASIGGGKWLPLLVYDDNNRLFKLNNFANRYAGNDYDLKTGVQMDAIYQMCKRLGL